MAEDDDGHDIPDDGMEPDGTPWTDQLRAQRDDLPEPIKVAIFFYGFSDDPEGKDVDNLIEAIGEFAENNGNLFYDWGATTEIDVEDIPVDSPLFRALVERLR